MDTKTGMAAFFTNIEESQAETKGPFKFTLRKGAEKDKKNFESVFFETFGLEPLTGNKEESSVINLTSKQWKHEKPIDKCTNCWVCRLKNADYSKCEYVLLGFSSHGNEELSADGVRQSTVILSDGNALLLSEIVRALDIESLKNKPKILMLLSCRVYTKPAEIFAIEILKDDETTTVFTGVPKILVLTYDDTSVVLRVTHQADVIDFEVQQATQTTGWTRAKLKEDKEETDTKDKDKDQKVKKISVENLQPDTTYCFVVRAKYANGFGPFSKLEFVCTFEAEDEGVDVIVGTADETVTEAEDDGVPVNVGTADETVTAQGEDDNDMDKLKKVFRFKYKKNTVTTLSDGDGSGDHNARTSSSNTPPMSNASSSNTPPMSNVSRFQRVSVDEIQPGSSERDNSQEGEANKKVFSQDNLPCDFLIVYGTTRGRMAKRNQIHGSWVMKSLTSVIEKEEEGKELNFLHLLTKVNQLMTYRKSEHETIKKLMNKKSISSFCQTLTEDIIFKKKGLSKPDL